MNTLYQSLVTVNPLTLVALIFNLFLTLFIVKIFFLDKLKAILDARREAADKQILDAEKAMQEAAVIKKTYEKNMEEAKAKADALLHSAQNTANLRSEEILKQTQQEVSLMKARASADIALEKKKAMNDAKNEISGLALAIAGKVVERELNEADQSQLIDRFLDDLGEGL